MSESGSYQISQSHNEKNQWLPYFELTPLEQVLSSGTWMPRGVSVVHCVSHGVPVTSMGGKMKPAR